MPANLDRFTLGVDWRVGTWRRFDHEAFERLASQAAEAGMAAIRMPLTWSEFQPDPHHASNSCLRDLEAVMNTCAALRLRLLPVVFSMPEDGPASPPWAGPDSEVVVEAQLLMLEVLAGYFRGHRALFGWELDARACESRGAGWRTEILPSLRRWDALHLLVLGIDQSNLIGDGRAALEAVGPDVDLILVRLRGDRSEAVRAASVVWRLVQKRVLLAVQGLPADDVLADHAEWMPRAGISGVFVPAPETKIEGL